MPTDPADYDVLVVDGSAKTSSDSEYRILLGGSWADDRVDNGSVALPWDGPASRSGDYGFRIVARSK